MSINADHQTRGDRFYLWWPASTFHEQIKLKTFLNTFTQIWDAMFLPILCHHFIYMHLFPRLLLGLIAGWWGGLARVIGRPRPCSLAAAPYDTRVSMINWYKILLQSTRLPCNHRTFISRLFVTIWLDLACPGPSIEESLAWARPSPVFTPWILHATPWGPQIWGW